MPASLRRSERSPRWLTVSSRYAAARRVARSDLARMNGIGESRTALGDTDLKGVMGRLYDAFNAGDQQALDTVVADAFVEHEITPGVAPGKAGLKQFAATLHRAFPDVAFKVADIRIRGGQGLGAGRRHRDSAWRVLRNSADRKSNRYRSVRHLPHRWWPDYGALGAIRPAGHDAPVGCPSGPR